MSRFSKIWEDPDYEDDISWDDDEADWEDMQQPAEAVNITSRTIKEAVGEDEVYSPYYGA